MESLPEIPAYLRVFQVLKMGGWMPRVVYDVGASTGAWSQGMFGLFPGAEFHLFEPLTEHHAPYRDGQAQCLREHPRFFQQTMALGESSGVVEMAISESPLGSTLLEVPVSKYFPDRLPVPLQRIDDLVTAGILPVPDLIKMDVQGTENRVLRGAGAVLERVQVLQVECWLYPGYGSGTAMMVEIIELLGRYGFVVVEFSDPYYGEGHQLYTLDLYFVKKELCSSFAKHWPSLV